MHPQSDQQDAPPIAVDAPHRAQRARFLAALALFLIWVAVMAGLAVLSARLPASRSDPGAAKPAAESTDAAGDRGP